MNIAMKLNSFEFQYQFSLNSLDLYAQVSKWVAETFESKELGKQQTLFES